MHWQSCMKRNKFAVNISTVTWMHCLSADKLDQVHHYSLLETRMSKKGISAARCYISHPMTCDSFELNNTYRTGTFFAKTELRHSLRPSQVQIFTECR